MKNLPDLKTESNEAVDLPPQLVKKWKAEGRYEKEVTELNTFFERTGYPRAPRFYIMKWLTDYITEFGIDGYRVDTVKHTEAYVWQEFNDQCDYTFAEYKKNNPEKVLDENGFYLVGEVYNYGISAKKAFDFGDKKVNYFDDAFDGLINFEAKWNAAQLPIDEFFMGFYMTAIQDDEILTAIHIPMRDGKFMGAYHKAERKVGDYATAGVAVQLGIGADGTCNYAGIGLTNVNFTR